MSASEKLKALDAAATNHPWALSVTSKKAVSVTPPGTGYMDHQEDAALIASLRNALPQIVAVVEAAEETTANLDDAIKAFVNSDMTQEDYDEWDAARTLGEAALAALDEALS